MIAMLKISCTHCSANRRSLDYRKGSNNMSMLAVEKDGERKKPLSPG
jgi:hypothetical protein